MMKKILAALMAVMMAGAVLAIGVSAAITGSVSENTWGSVELKTMLTEQGDGSGYFIETDEIYVEVACTSMRGFAVSPDGKHLFCGFLNIGDSGLVMLNGENGRIQGFYKHDDSLIPEKPYGYPKGLATDDRGNLYVGLASSSNYNTADFAIVDYNTVDEDMYLKEISVTNITTTGDVGDTSGYKLGINGLDVQKIGDKYYMYVVVNYEINRLYRFDVTDTAHPTLDTTFGKDQKGYLEMGISADSGASYTYEESISKDGKTLKEMDYFDVVDDGTIYACVTMDDGNRYVVKINATGSEILMMTDAAKKPYSICSVNDEYLVVGSKSGDEIDVLSIDTFEKITEVTVPTGCVRFTAVRVVKDILYVTDAHDNLGEAEHIYIAGLTTDAATRVDAIIKAVNEAPATEPETDKPATEPKSEAPTEEQTKTPATTPATNASTGAPTTVKPSSSSGCGSAVVGTVALAASVLMLGGVVAIRKKH